MHVRQIRIAAATLALLICTTAIAWGPADPRRLARWPIASSNAAVQVKTLPGGFSLETASVGADCAKGGDPAKGQHRL